MTRRWCCVWLIALTVTAGARHADQATQDRRAPEQPQPTAWTAYADRFLAEPDHEGDLSAASFSDDLVRTRARLAELRAMDASRLSKDDALDRRFVESLLVRREIDQARLRRWRLDPRVYMQSLQGVTARLDKGADRSPPAAAAVLDLLKAIPRDLRFGRRNLTLSVPHFQELALAMASAGRTSLTTAVTAFADTEPDQKDAILAAGGAARAALSDWTNYLAKEVPKKPTGYAATGIETYAAILRDQFLIQYSADELYEFTRREFERTQEQLKNAAAAMDDSRSWLAVAGDTGGTEVDELDDDAVTEVYRAGGETAREHLDASTLVAVPWTDAIAGWRFAKGEPAAESLFGTLDPAVVSIHADAEYGDRVRALYQMHNPSAVRRAHGAATFTGGWRLYVGQLLEGKMLASGDRVALRLLQLRLLAIVRVAVDIGIHTHRLTDAQALSFLTDRVGLTKAAAEKALAAAIDDPGSGLGYLGLTEITRLRDDVQKANVATFSLTNFHERLLSAGSMPLTLVRATLLD